MNKKIYIGLLCVILIIVLYTYWFDFLVIFLVKSLSNFTKSLFRALSI